MAPQYFGPALPRKFRKRALAAPARGHKIYDFQMQKGGNSHLAWIGATNLKTTRGLSRLSCSLRKRVRFPIVLYKMSTKKNSYFFFNFERP